jgi:hypothetical protein
LKATGEFLDLKGAAVFFVQSLQLVDDAPGRVAILQIGDGCQAAGCQGFIGGKERGLDEGHPLIAP